MSSGTRLLGLLLCASAGLALGCQDEPIFEPEVRVDKVPADGAGCHVVCDGQERIFDGGPALGDVCGEKVANTACGFAGGADDIRVVANLGPLEIDRLRGVPKAEFTLILDGKAQALSQPLDRSEEFPDGVTVFSGQVPAPAEPVLDMRVRVKLSDSFFSEPDVSFSVDAPRPTLEVTCQNDPCRRAADRIDVVVRAPAGLVGRDAVLRTKIDGALMGPSETKPLAQVFETEGSTVERAKATFSFLAPATGDVLEVEAQVGAFPASPKTVELAAPLVDTIVTGCSAGTKCVRGVDKVSILVRAPAALAGKMATVTTFVDDVLSAEQDNLLLAKVGDSAEKTLVVSVPATGKSLKIAARVESFAAEDEVIELQGPDLGIDVNGCGTGSCELVLAVDKVGVSIATHKQLAGTKATVTFVVDGVSEQPFEIPLVAGDEVAVGTETRPVIAAGETLVVKARVTGSDEATKTIALSPPKLSLEVVGCDPASPCVRERGVGSVTATLAGPPELAGQSVLITTSVDGVPGDEKTKTLVLGVAEDGTERAATTASFMVPTSGSDLVLDAHLASYPVNALAVDLVAPELVLDVEGCADPCVLPAGATATFVLYAPYGMQATAAEALGILDDAVTGEWVTIPIPIQDAACPEATFASGCRYGLKKVTVPNAPGKTWQLRAYLGQDSVLSSPIDVLSTAP